MKKTKFFLFFFTALIALPIFSALLISCPALHEEPFGKISGELTLSKWNDILADIYSKGNYVTLDLSACTPASSDNEVLKRVNEDGTDYTPVFYPGTTIINPYNDYIQFNASSGNKNGKELIKSLILPDVATMINNASNNINITLIGVNELNNYAFKHYTNLSSISGKKIYMVGTVAFYDCKNLTEVNLPQVRILMPFSFSNCTSLKNISFGYLKYIHLRAFENCTGLETAVFLSNPDQVTFPPDHPLDPWRAGTGLFTEDCFVIYDYAFSGCTSLNTLDIRNAWNVYFAGGCLSDIGTHLNLYLFDDNGTKSFGHPPIDFFLGGGNGKGPLTLTSLNIIIPQSGTMVEYRHNGAGAGYHGIAVWVDGILSTLGVSVTVDKLP